MPASNLAPEVEATNAAAVVTLAAPAAGKSLLITELIADYSAVPTGGALTVSDAESHTGCVTLSTSPVVQDASILQEDSGRAVSGTGIPSNAVIGEVIVGVSFEIFVAGVATNASASGTVTLTVAANFLFKIDITTAGETAPSLGLGIEVPPATAVVCTLAAGGSAIVGRLNVGYEEVS